MQETAAAVRAEDWEAALLGWRRATRYDLEVDVIPVPTEQRFDPAEEARHAAARDGLIAYAATLPPEDD